jgi:hypothetical protein
VGRDEIGGEEMDLTKFDAAREALRAAKEVLKTKKKAVQVALDEEDAAQEAVNKNCGDVERAFFAAGGVATSVGGHTTNVKGLLAVDVSKTVSAKTESTEVVLKKTFSVHSDEGDAILSAERKFYQATDGTRAEVFIVLFCALCLAGVLNENDKLVRFGGCFLNENGRWKQLATE